MALIKLNLKDLRLGSPFSWVAHFFEFSQTPDIIRAADCAELSVLDYLLWAVQRYVLKAERRYLTAMEGKIRLIYDVYDVSAANRIYNAENPFDLKKAAPYLTPKK